MAGRTIPSIATDLQKIKIARESGDATAEKLARQNFDIELAKLEGGMFEKAYNTAQSELREAYKAQRTAQAKINTFTHKTEIKKTKIQERGETKRKRMELDNKVVVQDDAQAHEIQLWDHKNKGIMALVDKYNLPQHSKDRIISGLAGADAADTDVVIAEMYEELVRDNPEKVESFVRDVTRLRHGEASRSGADRGPSLTQTERDNAGATVLGTMLRQAPIQTTDKNNKFLFWGGDKTESRMPTLEENKRYADDMIRESMRLGRAGLKPGELLLRIRDELDRSYSILGQSGGHDMPEAGPGGVEFEKSAEDFKKEPAKRQAQTEYIEQLKKAQKTVNFFHKENPAGQYFMDWLEESSDRGYFVQPNSRRMIAPTTPAALPPPEEEKPDETPEVVQEASPTTPATEEKSGNYLPGMSPNEQIQKDISDVADAVNDQGWEVGDFVRFTGEKRLSIKYGMSPPLVIPANTIFRVKKLVSEQGTMGTGVLLEPITNPQQFIKDLSPEEQRASNRNKNKRAFVVSIDNLSLFQVRE